MDTRPPRCAPSAWAAHWFAAFLKSIFAAASWSAGCAHRQIRFPREATTAGFRPPCLPMLTQDDPLPAGHAPRPLEQLGLAAKAALNSRKSRTRARSVRSARRITAMAVFVAMLLFGAAPPFLVGMGLSKSSGSAALAGVTRTVVASANVATGFLLGAASTCAGFAFCSRVSARAAHRRSHRFRVDNALPW